MKVQIFLKTVVLYVFIHSQIILHDFTIYMDEILILKTDACCRA